MNDEECAFSWEGTLGCYRVTAADDICIPPRSEIVIPASVTGKNNYGRADYLVEPEPKFLESGRALVGRTLVKGNDKVPFRLMNVTDDVQKIYRGTLIGKMTAVEENLNLTTFAEHSSGELRSDLKDLLDRSISNLLPEQVSKLRSFCAEIIIYLQLLTTI